MKIELRRFTQNERLSHETNCFAADIWIDGKKRGTVENAGHGGADNITPHSLKLALDAYGATLPRYTARNADLPYDAELLIADLVDKLVATKKLTRMMRTKIVMVDEQNHCFVARRPPSALSPAQLGSLKAKGFTVLNVLNIDEAVSAFLKAS